MAINFNHIAVGLNLRPVTSSTASALGDMDVSSSTNKLAFHNGTSSSPMVTEGHTATLTNKTIDGGSNTLSNIASGIAAGSITNSMIAASTIDLTAKVTGVLPNANTTGDSASTANALALRDANQSFSAFVGVGSSSVTLSGSTVTLTNTSPRVQVVTGAGASQTFTLPSTAGMRLGDGFYFYNYADTGSVTVNNFSGGNIATFPTLYSAIFQVTSTGSETGWAGPVFPVTTQNDGSLSLGTATVTAGIFTSNSSNPAGSGIIRLASADKIDFRNNANSADLALGKNASDALQWNAHTLMSSAGAIPAAALPAINVATSGAGGITGTQGVANGGTGVAATTAYAVLCGGTTTTGALQSIASVGTSGQVLTSNGAGALPTFAAGASSWTTGSKLNNVGLATSVAANALTIALKQSDGATDPASGASACNIGMRSSTATTGGYNERSVTAALSIVVPSGATLGHVSAVNQYVFVYALDNAGTVELAVSGVKLFDQQSVQSTTAIGAGSTSGTTLYSTTARTNVPIRYLGRATSNQTTAGTWVASMTEATTSLPAPVTMTDWATYTPATYQGLGTPTNVSFYWRRVGDSIQIRGYLDVGTVTASEMRIDYPSGVTSAGSTLLPTISAAGFYAVTFTGAQGGCVLMEQSKTYMTFGRNSAADAGLTKNNGNELLTNGAGVSFFSQVPVSGWSLYGP